MPSGKTHDAITYLCAVPCLVGGLVFPSAVMNIPLDLFGFVLSLLLTMAFLMGGLMFGPDLDTTSVQYHRWRAGRFLWYPYKKFFPHRSRYTHGLIFGTTIRVLYFCGVLLVFSTVILALTGAAHYKFTSGNDFNDLRTAEAGVGFSSRVMDSFFGHISGILTGTGEKIWPVAIVIYVGLWLGAASHTVADTFVSFVKTGKIRNFW